MRAHERRGLQRWDIQRMANERWRERGVYDRLSCERWLRRERLYLKEARRRQPHRMHDKIFAEYIERCRINLAKLRGYARPRLP